MIGLSLFLILHLYACQASSIRDCSLADLELGYVGQDVGSSFASGPDFRGAHPRAAGRRAFPISLTSSSQAAQLSIRITENTSYTSVKYRRNYPSSDIDHK
jgi:hypothetical protein